MNKHAVVLLSGGLDSTVCTYKAVTDDYTVHALTIQYGQLHAVEIEKAKITAKKLGLEHIILSLDFPWKGSALLDASLSLKVSKDNTDSIPNTYVPSRNIIFLSIAMSWAEVLGAEVIFIGVNQVDYSGYPDCRGEFIEALEKTFQVGTKCGIEGNKIRIKAPLLELTKKDIILLGEKLQVPFIDTWSCYKGEHSPCGMCDSCHLRQKGFYNAGIKDTYSI